MNDSITVLTPTKGRPDLLRRAISSVQNQDYAGEVRHLILIDDCPETYDKLRAWETPSKNLHWFLRPRSPKEQSGPMHLAGIRNLMVRMAETTWIAFLDDDNEYETNHLRELLRCAQQNSAPAAFSWQRVINADGTPYLTPRWPWCREAELGEERYQEMVRRGIISLGSNIIRDTTANLPYRCIDTSAWLLDRKLLLDNPIPNTFSYEEYINNKAEDDKLLMMLLALGVPIVCDEVVSLKYYLGGYSNNHTGQFTHSQVWEWQPA